MKERGIIFQGWKVRAILENRATMTRRPIRSPLHQWSIPPARMKDGYFTRWGNLSESVRCPYGKPGDRLWVRETWKCSAMSHYTPTNGPESAQYSISYKPDGRFPNCKTFKFENPKDNAWKKNRDGWRPSIHMPRWASRITLEITDIRVERLQSITEEDAVKEGVELGQYSATPTGSRLYCYKTGFRNLWESIYGKDSWTANPWVWCISFKRLD